MTPATTARVAADHLAVAQRHAGRAAAGNGDPLDVGVRPELTTRVRHDPRESVHQRDAAADRDRHASQLHRACDHLRHEPRDRVVGPEPGVEDPRREQAVGLLRTERRARPVAARRQRVPGEVEQAAPAEPSQHPLAEPEPGGRPELGSEHAEADVRVRHEALELPLPGGAVALREAIELGDVRLERGLEEHRGAVRECRRRRELRVHVLETAPVELVAELGVGRGALEERVPRAQHLVREPRQRVVGLGPDRTAETVGALEDAHAPPVPGEQRRGRQRVDPRADQHRVERRHGATLPRLPQLDMSPGGV